MMHQHFSSRVAATIVAAGVVSLLAGCATGGGGGGSSASPSSSVDSALAAKLPDKIRTAGTLTIGASLDYPPDNFIGDDGTTPTGYMVDLVNATGARLGLKVEYSRIDFGGILTGIEGGRYDAGISFLDTKEREGSLDMVGVYGAADSFLVMSDDAAKWDGIPCGQKVGVGAGSIEQTILEQLSVSECTDKGKEAMKVLTSPSSPQAQTAMTSGRVSAVFASTATAAWAVKESDGQFAVVGDPIKSGSGVTGFAVSTAQDGLAEALQASVQSLMDDGTYAEILKKWGVSGIAIEKATLNAAEK